MPRNLIAAIVVFACIGITQKSTFAQTAPIPSPAEYAASPDRGYSFSPNGQRFSFVSGSSENAKLYIFELGTGKAQEVPIGAAKFRDSVWGDDDHLLINVSLFQRLDGAPNDSIYQFEMQRTISYSLSKNKAVFIKPMEGISDNASIPIEFIDAKNKRVIVSAIETRTYPLSRLGDAPRYFYVLSLFEADLDKGGGGKIATGEVDTEAFFLDNEGVPRIRYDVDISQGSSKFSKLLNKKWVEFVNWQGVTKVPFSIEGFLNKDEVLLLDRENGKNIPKTYSMSTGEIKPYLNAPKESIDHTILDPVTKSPIGFSLVGYGKNLEWIDTDLKNAQALLNKTFAPKMVEMLSWDTSKTKFLLQVSSGNSAAQIYYFDTSKSIAQLIGGAAPVFDNFKGPPKNLYSFKASDGLEIPVFITKPDKIEKPMPAILLPHGGPEAQDDADFDYISQFLASRGYIIIQPQFRGSEGMGEEFEDLGKGEWSGKMQSDTIEALDWAIAQNWVDKNKVCIVGFSYGGYSAMVGETRAPDKFKCAATYGGVFDLAQMRDDLIKKSDGGSMSLTYWREHIGYSRYSTEKIREISPVNWAKSANSPILIIHGEEDTVVLPKQSEAMVKALKYAGKDVTFIKIPKEDHWLSTDIGKTRFLTELDRFLAGVLKPDQ